MDALLLAGMEYGVIKVVNRLPAAIEPSICCLRFQSEVTKPVLNSQVKVVALNQPTERNWRLIGMLARLFRRERIDIVHSHNYQTYLYAVLGARLAGVPVVIHGEHGHDEPAPPARRLMIKRRIAPLVTRFVTVSDNLASELRDDWKLAPERIVTIPNGVDLSLFRRDLDGGPARRGLGLGPDHEIILNVGGLRPVKDHATLIRAFARVREARPSARLVLVGGDYQGGLQGDLASLAASLGVAETVLFAGIRRDVADILAAGDVYVNSSTFEGMSNTILEAMAMGKPVIATAVGGNAELIRDGETGRLVPARDPEAMAGRILELLADPASGARIGAAAREHVERRHRMQRMVQAYADLYEETYDRWWLRRFTPVREDVKRALARGLVTFGIPAVGRRARPHSLTLLTYHRVLPLHQARVYPFQGMVLPRDEFERHMAHLARRYRVLPLPEAIERLASRTLPAKAVAITFDDGYRDNYEHAAPILRRYGLTATMFLVTDALDRRQRLWWDEVADGVARLARNGASHEALPAWVRSGLGREWKANPARAAARLVQVMNNANRGARHSAIAAIRGVAGTGPDDRDDLMMTWGEAREMLRDGFTFGSHTRTHAFLDELAEEEALGEVSDSARRLREALATTIRLLAYPRRPPVPHRAAILRRAGIEAAVSTEVGINRPGSDLHALRRVDAGYCRLRAGFDPAIFDAELSGLLQPFRSGDRDLSVGPPRSDEA